MTNRILTFLLIQATAAVLMWLVVVAGYALCCFILWRVIGVDMGLVRSLIVSHFFLGIFMCLNDKLYAAAMADVARLRGGR